MSDTLLPQSACNDTLAAESITIGATACPACGHSTDEHGLYGCNEGADAELAALRAKADAFDVLAARIASGAWSVYLSSEIDITIRIYQTGVKISAPTLAEAVRLAMEAEDGR